MKLEAVRVIIHGRVQGVGYRAWTIAQAELLDLRGWVRNRPDGTVEAIFRGVESAIEAMIEACKLGPAAARVDRIESFAWNEKLENDHFEARATG